MKINELLVHGDPRSKENIIAYKEHVWALEDDLDKDDEIVQHFIKTLQDYLGDEYEEVDDIGDIKMVVEDNNIPFIIGEIKGDMFVINQGVVNYRHSTHSSTLKKVLDEFNLDGVILHFMEFDDFGDEFEGTIHHSREEFLKPLKDKTYYHGTSLKKASSISKKGLMSQEDFSNYGTIQHEDKVFITLNPERASFHARTASSNDGSPACIIKLTIPDVNRLVLDYDVALELYGKNHPLTVELGYDEVLERSSGNPDVYKDLVNHNIQKSYVEQISDKSSLSTKFGVFGYLGRIPASHIQGYMVDESDIQSYVFKVELDDDVQYHSNFESLSHFSSWDEIKEIYDDYEKEIFDELETDEEDDDEDD